MKPDEPKRQAEDAEAAPPTKAAAPEPAPPASPPAGGSSPYVFKIVRADPKNDFDFENVADK